MNGSSMKAVGARWRSRSCLGASVGLLAAALGAVSAGCDASSAEDSGHEARTDDAAPDGPIRFAGSRDGALEAQLAQRAFLAMPESAYAFDARAGTIVASRSLVVAFEPGVTVGAANELLQGITGKVGGVAPDVAIVQIVLPADATPDMVADIVDRLRASPHVAGVVQDLLLTEEMLPTSADESRARWNWNPLDDDDGSWGLMFSNVPQAWNLERAIKAKKLPPVVVGVIDTDSFVNSPDITFAPGSDFSATQTHLHGTWVSSVVASRHDSTGIDGITPFAAVLAQYAHTPVSAARKARPATKKSPAVASFVVLLGSLYANPTIGSHRARVINMSLGAFTPGACSPQTVVPSGAGAAATCDPDALARTIDASGDVFAKVANAMNKDDLGTLFVVSAGNYSVPTPPSYLMNFRGVPVYNPGKNPSVEPVGNGYRSRWSSPWNNASVRNKADNIIPVEALERDGPLVMSSIDSGGMFAPGGRVGVSDDGVKVKLPSGTSLAAPMVAGAAAFLLAVEPTLKTSQLKHLLKDAPYAAPTTSPWSTTNTRLDLLASVLGIDDVVGDGRRPVQRMLCDIDDGTADGYSRFTYDPQAPGGRGRLTPVTTANTGAGDGHVDMKDFRRLRDALLRTNSPEPRESRDPLDQEVALSTGNGDGTWVYPAEGILRDRNGSGKAMPVEMFPRTEWTSVRFPTFASAAGMFEETLGSVGWRDFRSHRGQTVPHKRADLIVFGEVFEEGTAGSEGWTKADLEGLLHSADLHVIVRDIDTCGGGVTINVTGGGAPGSLAPLTGRRVTKSMTELVITTPVRNDVRIEWTADTAENGGGVHVVSRQIPAGGDEYVVLACEKPWRCPAEKSCPSVVASCAANEIFPNVRSDVMGTVAPAKAFACPEVEPCDFYCSS
jgi:hypothetical protein